MFSKGDLIRWWQPTPLYVAENKWVPEVGIVLGIVESEAGPWLNILRTDGTCRILYTGRYKGPKIEIISKST